MDFKAYFVVLRYVLLGTVAGIILSGALGFDAVLHDGVIAVIGGLIAGVGSKFLPVA